MPGDGYTGPVGCLAQQNIVDKQCLYVYVFQCECFCVDPTLCCDLRSKHSHKSSKLPFSMIKWSSVTVKPLNGFKSEANQSYTAGKSKNLEGLSTHLMQVMQWTQVRI